ncbi:adenylosuccinate lyase [Catalinimonas alkaloidigena]|uniref:Adenylosuccinate lyase n=1 Tax=Catalinimonas alkaloidigena TaxID=1075417 RepID=A0A1G9URT8_9BACT|nr:adenylosuccinate lyase [Catalinimonas alkaloidigena]SDM62527.1 adenylosuccinate lyase [Catalinimonas alkaloidigena]
MKQLDALTAIAPVDGRYRSQTESLAAYFSEFGLIHYRVRVEVEYFLALCRLPLPQLQDFPTEKYDALQEIYTAFSTDDARRIKELERTTNHDVKAVEYFLRERWEALGLSAYQEFIHFGLTSQDINNTAIPLSLRDAHAEVLQPALQATIDLLEALADQWRDVPMLARTHGQPASPTRLGKELRVFTARLRHQLATLEAVPFAAKFGGATGNFNAHAVAYPQVNWPAFANQFVGALGLQRSFPTTQIEHYDHLAAYCDAWRRIDTILIDLDRDVWQYISLGYFKQKLRAGEVGSSAMPHKVNPIDFENSEGNLGIANALLEHFAAKLPISRLQRDLTDSTVLRNLGVPLAHVLIALRSLQKGLNKLELHPQRIESDLTENFVVVAEALQTILRRENYPHPYEALRSLTRTNEVIDAAAFHRFIDQLEVSEAVKAEMKAITPFNYTGVDDSLS